MSVALTSFMWDLDVGDPLFKFLLVTLADSHGDDEGIIGPRLPIALLAETCGLDLDDVAEMLAQAEADGLLRRIPKGQPDFEGWYQFDLDRLAATFPPLKPPDRFVAQATPAPPTPRSPRKVIISEALRWEVWERDNFTCKNCGKRRFLTVDHVVPLATGGATEKANLQTLCKSCNSQKGDRPLPWQTRLGGGQR